MVLIHQGRDPVSENRIKVLEMSNVSDCHLWTGPDTGGTEKHRNTGAVCPCPIFNPNSERTKSDAISNCKEKVKGSQGPEVHRLK